MSFVRKSYPEYPGGPVPQTLLNAIASRATSTTLQLSNPYHKKFPWAKALRSSIALDPSLYFSHVQQQLSGENNDTFTRKYVTLQSQVAELEAKLARTSCQPALVRKNGISAENDGETIEELNKAKASAELRVVELEFLQALIARTTEELKILRSQMTIAESRVESSADNLTRVSQKYVKNHQQPTHQPTHEQALHFTLENNVPLTTIFFRSYLNSRTTAPPDSPKSSIHSTPPSSLFGRAERSASMSSSAKPPSLALLSEEAYSDMEMLTPKSSN